MQIAQKTVIRIDVHEIALAALSIPCWSQLADHEQPSADGFVRHGVPRAEDRVPRSCKMPYAAHVKAYLAKGQPGTSDGIRALLAIGTRNSVQNLFLPVYDVGQHPRLLARRDEPLQSTTYHALCASDEGGRITFSIERLRFVSTSAGWEATLPDRGALAGSLVEWAVTGQPILYDGEVSPHHLIAAVTYDLRHVWRLDWEDWHENDRHRDIHTQLMSAMMARLHEPVTERAATLAYIAARAGLAVQDAYLHSSISVAPDRRLINLVMMHGSFEQVARAHRELGASSAILLDNGGSVGVATWNRLPHSLAALADDAMPDPVFIGNATYFRPRGHAVLLLGLNRDVTELAFAARPPGEIAWHSS